MKRVLIISGLIGVAAFIILVFVFSSEKEVVSNKSYREAFRDNYKIFTPEIPNSISFAGEEMPLDIYYVNEKLDREFIINTYWHTSTILLLKRSNRWFPVIEPILEENGIPDDFKYLALIESGLINVKSPAGASGFWQFLEKTGREYGLEVNKAIDERYHVEKATQAACGYLIDSYEYFQNWTLVAAAYNAGKRRIREALEKQKTDNYYDLLLNEETSRYLFRILAMKTIYEKPVNYGFYLREADLYPPIPTKSIEVKKTIPDLVGFALDHGATYKTLKIFNPWLRSDKLPDESGRTYYVKIPKDGFLNSKKLQKQIKDFDAIFNDTVRVGELD
ncbi:MAG: hypothetical protein DRJ05_18600 [Bacteroidetes bacterium]|nr:MAG: hypothetical protein DRJ05_18600 [Bacteroidota bacterium]